jgi:ribosomal subunit interface protein
MDVGVVSGKGRAPEAVIEVAREKVGRLGRRAPILERADVRFCEDPDRPPASRLVCEVTISGHGRTIRASAAASDFLVALDLVIGKLEHQVERVKGKVLARTHPRRSRLVARV